MILYRVLSGNEDEPTYYLYRREAMAAVRHRKKIAIANKIRPEHRAVIIIEELTVKGAGKTRLVDALNGGRFWESKRMVWPKPKAR